MPVNVTFTQSDLLVDILKKELDAIQTTLVDAGDPDRIANTIAEQSQKVDDYTHRYALDEDRQKRLIRALVLFELDTVLNDEIAEGRQKKYDAAMKELEAIRDGKFPDLALVSPLPADIPPARGASGSAPRVRMRSDCRRHH